jgi:hypothetical protein
VTRLGARAEYGFSRTPSNDGQEAHDSDDFELRGGALLLTSAGRGGVLDTLARNGSTRSREAP